MKTLKLAMVALLAVGLNIATVNAQDGTKKTKSTTKTTAQKSDAKASPSGQHLKKDGTPDMRYKENKEAAKSSTSTPAATDKKTSTKSSSATKTKTTTKGSDKK